MYKKGGVYIDVDSGCTKSLNKLILPNDEAIITKESNLNLFVQWALIYRPGHPFLERTINNILDNFHRNRFPHNVHAMTGPSVYTKSINECLSENPSTPYRLFGVDYNGYLRARGKLVTGLISKKEHWTNAQNNTPVINL